MNVKNCRKCGRIFNYIAGPMICPQCLEKKEEEFQKVKQYIRENPDATVASTSEACEVEVQQIKQWVREERLTFSSAANTEITCERCGKPIMSGRFCDDCKKEMAKGLDASIQRPELPKPDLKQPESSGNRMHFRRQ